jgi:futalosine hydrolase
MQSASHQCTFERMSTLLVYAAEREGAPVVSKHPETLELGVGKIAATMSLSAALAKRKPDAVVLFGVCGAYPERHLRSGLKELQLLDLCMVASEIQADEGVLTPDGFLDLAHLKLGDIGPIPCDADLTGKISAVLGCPLVTGATVSTGSGVDALSQAYALRTGAQVESMEGGAVAAVCQRYEVPFAQLRVVSNRTGDRNKSAWDLDGALEKLHAAVEKVITAAVLP